MRNTKLIIIISFLFVFNLSSQNTGDTIVVQTFVHDAYTDGNGNTTISLQSGNPRDTDRLFPRLIHIFNLTFEKIIMSYNMRCKDNVVNTIGGTTRYDTIMWFVYL